MLRGSFEVILLVTTPYRLRLCTALRNSVCM